MKELSLQEIRAVELNLLHKFDSFCKENNIKYFLSNGTLLGAVKYKGFIPWDDDIDVFVPRDDYDRLISTFEDSDKYQLIAFEKDDRYGYSFANLCDMTTIKSEENLNNGLEVGVNIDIFALDGFGKNIDGAKKQIRIMKRLMLLLGISKIKKAFSGNLIKRTVKKCAVFLCKIIGSKRLVRKITKEGRRYTLEESSYCGCKTWCIYGEREIIPSDVFSDVITVEFEGQEFPAPVGYDTYLHSLYGDYEKDPPKEKQKTHHRFKAYQK